MTNFCFIAGEPMAPEEVEKREQMKRTRKYQKHGKKQTHKDNIAIESKSVNTASSNSLPADEKEKIETTTHTTATEQTKSERKPASRNSTEDTDKIILSHDVTSQPHPENSYSIENLLRTMPSLKNVPTQISGCDNLMSHALFLNRNSNTMTDLVRNAYLMTSWWRNPNLSSLFAHPGSSNSLEKYWLLQHIQARKNKLF